VQSGISVFDGSLPFHQRELRSEFLERCRVSSKGDHDFGRPKLELARVGVVRVAKGTALGAPFVSDCVVLYSEPSDERTKFVQSFVSVRYANYPRRQRSGAVTDQAAQLPQARISMEDHHHCAFGLLAKHVHR
jgi:hypothetical protein